MIKQSKRKKDVRSPFAKIRDKWFDGIKGTSMLADGATGEFLINRLERAFADGWDAREKFDARRTQKAATPAPSELNVLAGLAALAPDARKRVLDYAYSRWTSPSA